MYKKSTKQKAAALFSDGPAKPKRRREPKTKAVTAAPAAEKLVARLMDSALDVQVDLDHDDLAQTDTEQSTKSFSGFGDIFSALNTAASAKNEDWDDIPDAMRLMDLAISADLDPTIFTEQSFPVAENVIDWCRNPQFLGFTGEMWPRQIQILSRFFADVCYFCSDVEYVHNTPVDDNIGNVLDRFVLLRHGVCPMCRRNRTEMLADWINDSRFGRYNDYDEGVVLTPVPPNEFVGVWGQRSGKSYTVASFAAPYVLHRYLALPSAPRYFERPSNIVLEMAFVAPTLHQVDENLWMPFRSLYESSPWFREVKSHLISEGKRIGIPLYHAAATFILFPGKRIALWKLAASSQTLRGATRIFCVDGDSLINTTDGLIAMKNDLTGKHAWVNNKPCRVINHVETGQKPVQRTVLEKGYFIDTTLDHEIGVLTSDLKAVWKCAEDIKLGDYVAVTLGTKFPEELRLTYEPNRPVNRRLMTYRLMHKLRTFTSAQVFEETGLKGIYSLTHTLIKRGMLKKNYIKGKKNAGCIYAITDKFDLDKIEAEFENHTFKDRDLCTFPTVMTPELGYLLGYYVSEGSYNKGAAEFSFSNTNEIVVQHFISCFESVFGITPRVTTFKSSAGKQAYNVLISYNVIKKFLRYLGLTPSIALTKTVPWSILQSPKNVVLAFLSAFIEGDGSICLKRIRMFSSSFELIHQLQLLLLNLGIVGVVDKTEHCPPRRTMWRLRLCRYDSVKLISQLTCPTKGKLFNSDIGCRRHDAYKIPHLPAFVDTSLHGGSTAKYIYATSELNEDSYDSYALKRLQKEDSFKYSRVERLIDTGIIWLAVVDKQQLGSRPVFDLTVDNDDHMFTANGIVVHNCTLDELAWFNSSEDGKRRSGVKDGVEVFNSLSNSLSTIRSAAARRRDRLRDYNALDAYMFNISSPCSVSDPIMQQAAIASQHPRMYYTHHATWEVNPWEDQQTIMEQTAGRPEVYKRDFCAIPPRALSPFFPNAQQVRDLESKNDIHQLPLFAYNIQQYRDSVDPTNALLRPTITNIQMDPFGSRILAVDNGEVNNSFALCLASFDPEVDGIVYDNFVEVAPQRGLVVDLAWCYNEFILPLVKTFNILFVVFDRWNSAQQVMDLRTNHAVKAERYTVKWADFCEFREDISNTKTRFPVAELDPDDLLQMRLNLRSEYPNAHFQLQLTTVEQFGKKLFKPENGNDDLFRVAVLAHAFMKKNRDVFLKSSGRRRGAYGGQSRASGSAFRGGSERGGGGRGTSMSTSTGGRSVGAFYNPKRKALGSR